MRLGIKGKQVLGVTSLVGAVVVSLSVLHPASVARVSLDESSARAELVANAIYHRAFNVVAIYSSQGQNLEYRQPLFGDREIGSIRIGVSTLLIREDLDGSLRPALL